MYENRIFKRDAFNEVTRETRATAGALRETYELGRDIVLVGMNPEHFKAVDGTKDFYSVNKSSTGAKNASHEMRAHVVAGVTGKINDIPVENAEIPQHGVYNGCNNLGSLSQEIVSNSPANKDEKAVDAAVKSYYQQSNKSNFQKNAAPFKKAIPSKR